MKTKTQVYFYTEDGRDWKLEAIVYPGSAGTYNDPPEHPEVEFGLVSQDLGSSFMGPRLVYDLDDFMEAHGLTEAWCYDQEDKAIENAAEDQEDSFDEDDHSYDRED